MRKIWAGIENTTSGRQLKSPLRRTGRSFGLSKPIIEEARKQVNHFIDRAPLYPSDRYAGKGIVMTGGGMKYLPPALISLAILRKTGCVLPVELWVLPDEAVSMPRSIKRGLQTLQVEIKSLQDVYEAAQVAFRGYRCKVFSIIFSRFEEVLFLDSDNIPLEDPTLLFFTEEYKASGAIFWPDIWPETVAPDFYRILRLSPGTQVNGTHDSGQLLIRKQQCWRPLLLAAFFNLHSQLYYPLQVKKHGMGDKETFALAWLALGYPYHRVQWPVEIVTSGEPNGGIGMLQRSVAGKALFLHTTLRKFSLECLPRHILEEAAPRPWGAHHKR
ncbi:hypothetical protein CYMTET_41296 [Cymbomonas tetramitiformis]|uniref:Alpha-1,2-mannosyltransferase n=1 Tax=Cymbomonas tetramitiformis TaxID=36881 RepID=A0AAE0C6C0_9CHLO|nr:hypothetical protein CYMTET_41295 [Cymbomonas tetramitiformis]KAK3249266.1 hypothetical protein CYMTET_41296 [Cymbomonas tetramitiformis]